MAIARALAMRPQVLLLDEVTSALDPELVAGVLDVLRDIAHTRTSRCCCVTHEMNFARDISDQVLMFDQGRVIEAGPPEKIFTDPEHERTREFLERGAVSGHDAADRLGYRRPATEHAVGICQGGAALLSGPPASNMFNTRPNRPLGGYRGTKPRRGKPAIRCPSGGDPWP